MNSGCYWIGTLCTSETEFAAAWRALGYQVNGLSIPATDAVARAEAWLEGRLSGIASGNGNAAPMIGIIHDTAVQAVTEGKILLRVEHESLNDLLARWT